MRINELHAPEGPDLLAALFALGIVIAGIAIAAALSGCAHTPAVEVASARCDVAHTDEVAASVACSVELYVDAQRVELELQTTLDEQIEDRCVLLEFEIGVWSFGGLIPAPVSAEACEEQHAPFGLGALQQRRPSDSTSAP